MKGLASQFGICPMTDELEIIRTRHEEAEKIYAPIGKRAASHADRATLLRHVDRLSAELVAERERRVDGWQPIETAPKDGTQILACAQISEHLTAAIISSQGHLPDLSIVKWDNREKDFIAMADGYMSIKSQGDTWTTYHEPYVTHWMPLPIPPATLKDTGQ